MRPHSLGFPCASASFIGIPAFAQTSTQPNHSEASNQSASTQPGMNPRHGLRNDLEKAGFTKIRIEPEAFIVHAVNSQGELVPMRIGPDTMETVTALKMGSPNTSASNASGSSSAHSTTKTK